MKALIFIPFELSIGQMIVEGFEENGWNTKIIDYKYLIPKWNSTLYIKTTGLPRKINAKIQTDYIKKVNRKYLEIIENEKPELILIYNNQLFSPELLKKIKNEIKISFLLGDYPLFSHTSDTNLKILQYSDFTISPDTFWKKELENIGMPNIHFSILGYSKKSHYKIEQISLNDRIKYSNDLVFIGTNYLGSAGYKRCMFYNHFTEFDFKLYGSGSWSKWKDDFPLLFNKVDLINERISINKFNLILNCCKIFPIDQNPFIINGIHSRVFESIGSEILPLVEYRPDLDIIFKEVKIPVIKKYSESSKSAIYFLKNEYERLNRIKELKEYIDEYYLPKNAIKNIINSI